MKWQVRIGVLAIFLFFGLTSYGQSGQIDINRVQLMPNLPSPYIMRDWKDVAFKYDSIIYSLNASGQYLPVMHLKPSGVNYPSLQPILLDSYVGSASSGSQSESINVIPSVVGASIVGIDKSNQGGINWVAKTKDFFNKANGQNVYLNGPSSTSGSDWWYDAMPNVFFYQLYSLYPNTPDFSDQFTTIADRWLQAVHIMGGSDSPWSLAQMDYRGFNFSTQTPNSSGITEPEAAGPVAWMLYHAYLKTNNKKYLSGARQAIGFLSNLNVNPAYEIQLPYGTFIAAKMNAELGTNYDIEKMINWSFDQSSKRNWGTIVGSWGDGGNVDVSGLVGEIDNPNTGYGFAMNGFEQAAALVPLVKYDKRFARTIGKWVLNVANASRLYYPQYLPAGNQDDLAWSTAHDAHSVIPYEALKQDWNGTKLYGTGDAKRNGWAQTNLGLYGGSHVGYLAALIDKTDVDGILLLNVNKTDFYGQNTYPSYLAYNPYGTAKVVTLPLSGGTRDIYDAISETTVKTGVTGSTTVTIPANAAMLFVYLPSGSTPVPSNGKLMIGNDVVDFHYGYDFDPKIHIQSLTTADTLAEFGQQVSVYHSVENVTGTVSTTWYLDGQQISTSSTDPFLFTTPVSEGYYWLRVNVQDDAGSTLDSIRFHVVEHIPRAPVITGFTADQPFYLKGSLATITVAATGGETYEWTVPTGGGSVVTDGATLHWTVPNADGLYPVSVSVNNSDGLPATVGVYNLLVKSTTAGQTAAVAYYPFDGDVLDYSGNDLNAVSQGVTKTADALGNADKAYHFATVSDLIYVPNASALNFQQQITISFWVKLDAVTEETYLVSHGSYEQRYKISVLSSGKLRWTIKTTTGTFDLDNSEPLATNHYYHIAALYTGYSMELYIDGELDTYRPVTGSLLTSTRELTFGKKDTGTQQYHLFGSLDEMRIYDKGLEPDEIATLKTLWHEETGPVTSVESTSSQITVYPNPATGDIFIDGIPEQVQSVSLVSNTGSSSDLSYVRMPSSSTIRVFIGTHVASFSIVRIETTERVVFRKIVIQ